MVSSQRTLSSAAATAILVVAMFAVPSAGAAHLVPHGLHPQMAPSKIYSDTANAREDIRQALLEAASGHKRVLLDFGGNWCGDCQLLNIYFHSPSNAGLLNANYILVDVNIGEYDKNLDLAHQYGIPLNKGVPALAVLDSKGRVVYAQRSGEFESMRKLDSNVVTAFLQKWKPTPASSHPPKTHRRQPATGNHGLVAEKRPS